jgi:hypothetical protein
MANEGKHFLGLLDATLGEGGQNTLYPCIRDLVEHGLDLARFAAGDRTPQRQDVTQYLAAWSRHAGLSEEQASAWLVDYCVALLASLSSRTPAAIRHSAKSNLRYIYRSSIPFLCHCEKNPFRANCRPDCPVYADMQAKLHAKASELAQPFPRPPAPVIKHVLRVKESCMEQFQTGLRIALEEDRKGTKMRRIVEILKERGLKTRTGREWKYAILRNELLTLKNSQVPPQDGRQGACPMEHPNAELGPAPNDGPMVQFGNSGVTQRPP